jgi:hypothetical protein
VDLDFDLTKDFSISQVNKLKNDMFDYLSLKLSKIK